MVIFILKRSNFNFGNCKFFQISIYKNSNLSFFKSIFQFKCIENGDFLHRKFQISTLKIGNFSKFQSLENWIFFSSLKSIFEIDFFWKFLVPKCLFQNVSFVFHVLKTILSVWVLKSITNVLLFLETIVCSSIYTRPSLGKGEHADPFSVARQAQNI